MNPDIKDFDVDTSEDKKSDSVHVSKITSKNKIFIAAFSLVLIFLFLAISSYKFLESLEYGSVIGLSYKGENFYKLAYPISALLLITVVICLRGIDGYTLDLSKITKRVILGLIVFVISLSTGIVSYISLVYHKESRRKYAENLVMIDESLKAEKVLKNYFIDYPEDRYGMIDLAFLYWNNGKRDQSLVIFETFEKKFHPNPDLSLGTYSEGKIQLIARKELEKLHSFIHKCEIPEGFYEEANRLEKLCRIRPLASQSEIHGVKIMEWWKEESFEAYRESRILRSFASWLDTSDNNNAIDSAFQLDRDVKTLVEFRDIAVSWAQACRRNNITEGSQKAGQLISDIDKRCEIEMKKLGEK